MIESNSLLTALFQNGVFGEAMASAKVLGTFSNKNSIRKSLPKDYSFRALLLLRGSSFSSFSEISFIEISTFVLVSEFLSLFLSFRVRFEPCFSLCGKIFSKKDAYLDSMTVFS